MDRTSITGLATQPLESALHVCIASCVLSKGWSPFGGAGAALGVLEFHAAKAGARQAHVLPVTSLHCRRAKSAGTGAVPGGDGGQAGIVPGHQEEAMGVFGTASLPSGQTICSPGCECCELARGQSGAAVWPLCPLSHGGSCVQGQPGSLSWSCLGVALQVSCPCRDLAVPVLGCRWLLPEQREPLCCSAGQGACSGQGSSEPAWLWEPA